MKRLAVIDTGPPPFGDLFGPPEDLESYVLGALARGEPVEQLHIDLVNEWRANNGRAPINIDRAKSGRKA